MQSRIPGGRFGGIVDLVKWLAYGMKVRELTRS